MLHPTDVFGVPFIFILVISSTNSGSSKETWSLPGGSQCIRKNHSGSPRSGGGMPGKKNLVMMGVFLDHTGKQINFTSDFYFLKPAAKIVWKLVGSIDVEPPDLEQLTQHRKTNHWHVVTEQSMGLLQSAKQGTKQLLLNSQAAWGVRVEVLGSHLWKLCFRSVFSSCKRW